MLLTSILLVPFVVGLACLFARPRAFVEMLNLFGFVSVLVLGLELFRTVLLEKGKAVVEWGEFLRADALSVWMILLSSLVSLAASIYAVRYFRRELSQGSVNERRFREFYVLTPFFGTGMLLVVLCNNLGVMWVA